MSFSDEEVAAFIKNPVIFDVSRDQITLTLPFKQAIYDEWIKDPTAYNVRRILRENGIAPERLPKLFYRNLTYTFKRCGRPTRENPLKYSLKKTFSPPPVDGKPFEQEDLVATGKFVCCGSGIDFTAEFAQELFGTYPDKPLPDAIREAGIDPGMVGYSLIRRLEKQFKRVAEAGIKPGSSRVTGRYFPEEKLDDLRKNPYVSVVSTGRMELSESFYKSAASLASLPIDEILKVYFIEEGSLTITEKIRAMRRLQETPPGLWKTGTEGTGFEAAVLRRKVAALMSIAENGFALLAKQFPEMPTCRKKAVCGWIETLPKDPSGKYTKRWIMKQIGLSKSSYYQYVKKENYGIARYTADREAAEAIRMVYTYKGFRKGIRQVYMLLPRLTGVAVGINRVRRIMKAEGLCSGIRGPNMARRRAAAIAEGTVKPDLLKRRFRLYRPNQVRVTDVTYLRYGPADEEGEKKKAYGSALMDPVTGKLLAFVVSDNNDLELAMETLRESDAAPCMAGGIFHSDQGVLYRAKDFQKAVVDRGLEQSMSKRGNCWDNATQESFFGQFKEECPYEGCNDLEALKKMVAEYAYYYNNERGLWDRGKMTPVEYERYLLSLDEEAYCMYLRREEEKYEQMKARSAVLAKKRYGTLGV